LASFACSSAGLLEDGQLYPLRGLARFRNEICSSVVGFVLFLGCWWFINVLIAALKMLQQ
jgi:hypothetical protein